MTNRHRLETRIAVLGVLVIILGLGWAYRIISERPVVLPRGEKLTFIVNVKEEPRLSDKNQVLRIGDAMVYADLFPRYFVGDKLKIEGEINRDGFLFDPKIEKVGYSNTLSAIFSKFRFKLSSNINSLLPSREATLIIGTVLGIDSINRVFRDQLIKTGTIHVVVVSGQNLTIVAGVFISLARYLGRRNSLILATLAVFAYALLTGFQPPVVRASLMVLASTLAVVTGRQATGLWTLVVAALIIIFVWPRAVFEISFQLTFAATLGIMTLGNFWAKKWEKLPFFGQNAAISISAFIFTAPIILFYFGRISPIAPFANIIVIEAVAPVMILGFIVSIFSLIFMPLAQLLAYFAFIPAFYFTKIVGLFSTIPVDQIELSKNNLLLVLGLYVSVLSLIILWIRKSKEKSGSAI